MGADCILPLAKQLSKPHVGEVAAIFMYGWGSLEFSCARFEPKTPRPKR